MKPRVFLAGKHWYCYLNTQYARGNTPLEAVKLYYDNITNTVEGWINFDKHQIVASVLQKRTRSG